MLCKTDHETGRDENPYTHSLLPLSTHTFRADLKLPKLEEYESNIEAKVGERIWRVGGKRLLDIVFKVIEARDNCIYYLHTFCETNTIL